MQVAEGLRVLLARCCTPRACIRSSSSSPEREDISILVAPRRGVLDEIGVRVGDAIRCLEQLTQCAVDLLTRSLADLAFLCASSCCSFCLCASASAWALASASSLLFLPFSYRCSFLLLSASASASASALAAVTPSSTGTRSIAQKG